MENMPDISELNVKTINMTRGYPKYEAALKDLEGILNKLKGLFDIKSYEIRLSVIKSKVESESKGLNSMLSESMQMDYEAFFYDNPCKEIKKLKDDIEREYSSLYTLHIVSTKINELLANVNGENIGEIINDTSSLIDTLNSIGSSKIREAGELIKDAYRTIYNVIIYEELFERSDIFNYIKKLNLKVNIENLGRLLDADIEKLQSDIKRRLVNENLASINTEGLGYDYFTLDIIKEVSRNTVGESNPEYQTRKRMAIEKLEYQANSLLTRKNESLAQYNKNANEITSKKIASLLVVLRLVSMFSVPVFTGIGGNIIGKNASNKITEYKTITRTVDLNTGDVVGEQKIIYDENETTYVATVLEYSPWCKNPVGNGYIRDVTAYEYIAPENVPEGHRITSYEIDENTLEKYKYVESKETLDSNDSTTETTIMITETYQDKNDNRKSTKYIVPFTIIGVGIGIVITVILSMLPVVGVQDTIEALEKIARDIKRYKLKNEQIIARLKELESEAIELQARYNETVIKFGNIDKDLINTEYNFGDTTITGKNLKVRRKK